MDSPSKSSDNTSNVVAVSVAIDNLTLLATDSPNETSCPSKNSETEVVEVLPQSDVNCNEIYANNSPLMTRDETAIRPVTLADNREHAVTLPENFDPAKAGRLTRGMQAALRHSFQEKVKIDYAIRQNAHSNPQQNSNSLDCVVTLYDSASEDSDCFYHSDDDSTDRHSELEYLGSFEVQKLSSSDDESLRSDGRSIESSEYLSDSDRDSNDSDEDLSDSAEDSSDSDDEPCDSDEQPSEGDPGHSDKDSSTSSEDEKPDPSDDDDSGDDGSSANDEDSSEHDDEEESSDDDKSIDLEDSSESSNDSSDNSE